MTRPSKRKFNIKEQERDNNGRFAKKIQTVDNWGDDDDSGWDYDNGWDNDVNWSDNLLNERKKVELVWSNNAYLERKKRGPYLTGKTKKSTYFDKYGPSGSFTKAAKGTKKITTFLIKNSIPDDFDKILGDSENDEQDNQYNLNERIEILKKELKEQQKVLTVTECNKKRAVFEYLNRLDGKGKQRASMEAAQLVFIESAPYRARSIRYWANYWLQHIYSICYHCSWSCDLL